MNILYDHQAVSLHRYGGISRYFYELANRIGAQPGHRVQVFSPLYVNEYFHTHGAVRPTGFYVPPVPRTLRVVRAINNLASVSLRARRNVDLFHETYYSSRDFCPRGARRILTIYDMIHERFPSYFRRDDDTSRLKALAADRADHVICISHHTKRDLIELFGVPEGKISVVHLGYSLTGAGARASPPLAGKPYILYVGHRNAFRNVARLLASYAGSPILKGGFSLVFFGGGRLSVDEQAMIARLSLTDRDVIQISGNDGMLAALYRGASAFVYPSLYEGFGIPPLEAMSFGCPVVCSNTSSMPEVVGDAAELFDPEDEAGMRRALENVVTSRERADVLIQRGHERCQQFSWKKCAMETLDIYTRVLNA